MESETRSKGLSASVDTTAHAPDLDWRDALVLNSRGLVRERDVQAVDKFLSQAPPGAF